MNIPMEIEVTGIDSLGVVAIEYRLRLPEGCTDVIIEGVPVDDNPTLVIEVNITQLEST